jgi:hypothetical protein
LTSRAGAPHDGRMPERDAFGREIGEDSLGAMGWSPSAAAAPHAPELPAAEAEAPPGPAVAAAPAAEPPPVRVTRPPARRPVTIGRRRRGRGLGFLLILLAVLLVIGGGVFRVASDAVDEIQGAIDQSTVAPPGPSESLINPQPLKAALAKLPPGTLQSLRVAPGRIDAQVFSRGRMHVVQVTSAGRVTDVRTDVAARQQKLRLVAAAPRRTARAAAREAGRPVSGVSYLVLGRTGWDLFFTDGRHYSAGVAGRHVRHVG